MRRAATLDLLPDSHNVIAGFLHMLKCIGKLAKVILEGIQHIDMTMSSITQTQIQLLHLFLHMISG
ncbi:hypothetical protein DNH61_13125 [Paenibacillus sambharensis]|uniref:Uncharacterized protein n=1 Tax=Paenibacillus sambharensis TaxID=1803190 RepID=A0A2W1LBG9_9BACL|nr:hypothetical protein DNH61_13125 [Paenibacillus sambharensis]